MCNIFDSDDESQDSYKNKIKKFLDTSSSFSD